MQPKHVFADPIRNASCNNASLYSGSFYKAKSSPVFLLTTTAELKKELTGKISIKKFCG